MARRIVSLYGRRTQEPRAYAIYNKWGGESCAFAVWHDAKGSSVGMGAIVEDK